MSQYSLDGKILLRSITPLLNYWLPGNNTLFPPIAGTKDGDAYCVYSINSNGWAQAKSGALKYWSDDELLSSPELIKHFIRPEICNQFLIVDHLIDKNDASRIMHNSPTSVELLLAVVNALILHHEAQGPHIENTWQLQSPLLGIGRSWSLVSMNRAFCRSTHLVESSAGDFSVTVKALLDKGWGDSQFGRVLELALTSLSGSLRTLKAHHSFALLAMTFEVLFTKCENDFAGGSKRLARLTGNTKKEVTSLHQFLNGDDTNSVRNLRNRVIHGSDSIYENNLESVRVRFANLLAQATIFLVQHFTTMPLTGNYYDELEEIAEDRFSSLPTH